MRGKKADRDKPKFWAIKELRDAGLTVCPLTNLPLPDVGARSLAVNQAFWAMYVDAVKAHEGVATPADRERAKASSEAYHAALESESQPVSYTPASP